MKLKISLKNSKIGPIPNLSLPPGKSCVPGIPCYHDGCYAKGPYKRYPNTKKAWDLNLAYYREDPVGFFCEFNDWLLKHKPKLFRTFVGGDFPDEKFYAMYNAFTAVHKRTTFLAFTKRYDYDFSNRSTNNHIVLSTWPGLALPTNRDLPWSWLEEDPRKPEEYLRCPGNCYELCGNKCWKLDIDVVFPKHR